MPLVLLFLLLAYVLGATPTSYWAGRWFYGTDLREAGSGNLGATNTYRVLGWKAAIPVLVVDVLKGWLPAWWFPQLHGGADPTWAIGYGAAAVLGHVFSFWVGFRGGKGVATSAGVLTALAPGAMAVGVVVWFVALGLTRIVSVGSMAAAVAAPLWATLDSVANPAVTVFLWLLGTFILWAHRSNIRRLVRGEEPRVGRSKASVS